MGLEVLDGDTGVFNTTTNVFVTPRGYASFSGGTSMGSVYNTNNISSITRVSGGRYLVTWFYLMNTDSSNNSLPYPCFAGGKRSAANSVTIASIGAKNGSSVTLFFTGATGTLADPQFAWVTAFSNEG